MAMKKAELEEQSDQYHRKLTQARAAENRGLYREALNLAVSAWEYIDGMMQYGRRYEKAEFDRIHAIDLALRYAPLLLDVRRIDTLEQLLREVKRITRNAGDDFDAKVARARQQVSENHRLWSHLQNTPGVRQDTLAKTLGGDQDRWRSVSESWEKMGLLTRTPEANSYRLSLATRMGEVVSGKCPRCGKIAEAPKGMFLEPTACPKCRQTVVFVLLAAAVSPKG